MSGAEPTLTLSWRAVQGTYCRLLGDGLESSVSAGMVSLAYLFFTSPVRCVTPPQIYIFQSFISNSFFVVSTPEFRVLVHKYWLNELRIL